MVSNWVNIARALKGLYDLSFSQEPFYVNSRAELRNDVKHSIAQFQAALDEPPVEEPPLIRKPFKIMLYFLLALVLVSIVLGGRL
jgi:hypothetical protein